jgi:hypothetical protein
VTCSNSLCKHIMISTPPCICEAGHPGNTCVPTGGGCNVAVPVCDGPLGVHCQ